MKFPCLLFDDKAKTGKKNKKGEERDKPGSLVQCDLCDKWRYIPNRILEQGLQETWECKMNTWEPDMASCDISAEESGEGSGSEVTTSSVPGSDDNLGRDEGSKKSATPALQPRSSSKISQRKGSSDSMETQKTKKQKESARKKRGRATIKERLISFLDILL